MVRVYRFKNQDLVVSGGYERKYVADIDFSQSISNAGVIWVMIPKGNSTSPHYHEYLEEVFIILDKVKMNVDEISYNLDTGDVVVVTPNESHWFEACFDESVRIATIKLPNITTDKKLILHQSK